MLVGGYFESTDGLAGALIDLLTISKIKISMAFSIMNLF